MYFTNEGSVKGFGVPEGYQRHIIPEPQLEPASPSNSYISSKLIDDNDQAEYVNSESSNQKSSSRLKNSETAQPKEAAENPRGMSVERNSDTQESFRKLCMIVAVVLVVIVLVFVKFSSMSMVLREHKAHTDYIVKRFKPAKSIGSVKDSEEESVKLLPSDKQSYFTQFLK
mmetsp:Transcript_17742/g.20502  ORF Transcript_17742/g.20502 Transcript_17742/m.20502 type:complete len:171 (-) Transcript_17742:18-530(-)|eukprot:CAMPEP_0168341476 /NCGR_PEP_ID=MMETSP0213-20121227/14714_1 /TAXON_ID=151035 /ORGANISM="Euplotes harpa, Strain FSP1.4" /LENGTH=170 /DNA_ID=CAMNT_0008347975 /DNA_START=81 /DNA_END=593 /DNA_ORIENTATION=+